MVRRVHQASVLRQARAALGAHSLLRGATTLYFNAQAYLQQVPERAEHASLLVQGEELHRSPGRSRSG